MNTPTKRDKYEVRRINQGLSVQRLDGDPHETGSIIVYVPKSFQASHRDVLSFTKRTVRALDRREVLEVFRGGKSVHATSITS